MLQPFNALQAEFLTAITEALFHDVDMVIPPRQVVDNLQHQFGLIAGGKPGQIALLIDALSIILGGPLFLLQSPAGRAAIIESRLQES